MRKESFTGYLTSAISPLKVNVSISKDVILVLSRSVGQRKTDLRKEFERWPCPVISYPDLLSSTRDLGHLFSFFFLIWDIWVRDYPSCLFPPPHPCPLLSVRQFIFAGCNSCEFLRFLSRSAKSSLFWWQNDKHINIWWLVSSTTTFYLKPVEEWRLLSCFPAKMTLIRRAHY